MTPEHISGDLWKMLQGEYVVGKTGAGEEVRLDGPLIVKAHEFEGHGFLLIQTGNQKVQVEGTYLPSVVKTDVP